MRTILSLLLIGIISFSFRAEARNREQLQFKEEAIVKEDIKLQAHIQTSKGEININLFPEVAPITVANFINLAEKGYYDNLTFHRVISNFMIQGGCPLGRGTSGPGYNFKDEFPSTQNEKYKFNRPGILAMANAGPGTNGSQFFITHVPTDWLNNKHTIFGEVISPTDQNTVNSINGGDIIKSISITGNVAEFIEDNEGIFKQLDEALGINFPQLVN